jgi:ATP-dependent DNA helicase RecQ
VGRFTLAQATAIASKYWGFAQLRPMQQEVIGAIADNDAVLAVLATGGGKSLCFQIPALLADRPTIVFSPLLALMRDQIQRLHRNSVPAFALNSENTPAERHDYFGRWRSGGPLLIYMAPESLANDDILHMIKSYPPAYFVVDEAHCISQWGHDFRPAYRHLSYWLRQLPQAPLIALTATASLSVQVEICQVLAADRRWQSCIGSFCRKNINLEVAAMRPKLLSFRDYLQSLPRPLLIFAGSRMRCEKIAAFICQEWPWQARAYHAGLSAQARQDLQSAFLADEIEILAATCAFGMGVDKANIRSVMHVDLPATLDAFYQEVGRAGRDGQEARHILLQDSGDGQRHRHSLNQQYAKAEELHQLWPQKRALSYRELLQSLPERIVNTTLEHWSSSGLIRIETSPGDWQIKQRHGDYANAEKLVRQHWYEAMQHFAYLESYAWCSDCRMRYLVHYFGEDTGACGHCDICQQGGAEVAENPDPLASKLLQAIVTQTKPSRLRPFAAHVCGRLRIPGAEAWAQLTNYSEGQIVSSLLALQRNHYLKAPRETGFQLVVTGRTRAFLQRLKQTN